MDYSKMSDQEKLEYSRAFRKAAVDAFCQIGNLISVLDKDYESYAGSIKSLLQAQVHLLEQVRIADLHMAELEQKLSRHLHIVK